MTIKNVLIWIWIMLVKRFLVPTNKQMKKHSFKNDEKLVGARRLVSMVCESKGGEEYLKKYV
jgi:hypothetical protein